MTRRGRIVGIVLPVPERLSRLADRIRRPYDPNFQRIGPHVTVLPPREVHLSRREVVEAVARAALRSRSFPISLGAIRTFRPVMPVVFASLRAGRDELERLHRRLSRGTLKGEEVFPYVPHLTLGQKLDSRRLLRALALSRRLFTEAREKRWLADRLIIVERLSEDVWLPHTAIWLPVTPSSLPPLADSRRPRHSRRKT
ncbi:MAG: 2'-5' RNA ligase family protein [Acidobacteria bacterium]|nr:2'-5' RNA ligase family protein [Acidobacteriota bacterium]